MRILQDTGIPWVGLAPQNWNVKQNKYIMTSYRNICEHYNNEPILSLTLDGVVIRDIENFKGKRAKSYDGYQNCRIGNLLMCLFDIDVTPRCIGLIKNNGVCTSAYRQFSVKKNEYAPFYYYYYLSLDFTKELLHLARNIRNSITATEFLNIKTIEPPYEEQKAIVDFLDSKCAAIDDSIAKHEALIQKLEEYRKALITQVVTKGLDPTVPMRDSGNKYTGRIPKTWKFCKMLYVLAMPITDGPHTTPKLYPKGIPFVSAEAVSCGNGRIDFNHIRGFISKEFYEECCKKYIPQQGDVYMIKSGATTGKVAIVDTSKIFTIWSPLAVIRTKKNIMRPKFMFYYLQSDGFQRQVELNWNYGTQQNIGMRAIEKLKICVPSPDIQDSIINYLNYQTNEIDSGINQHQYIIDKLKEYKQSLIYYAVTGKIDCRSESEKVKEA